MRRRSFLTGSAAAAAAWSSSARAYGAPQFGPLITDPAGILDLPRGFSYTVVDRMGDPTDDGYLVPGAPDGMACFPLANGNIALMRNHELDFIDGKRSAYVGGASPPAVAWDPTAYGGVSRVEVDPETGERLSCNMVLLGSSRNCCGGPSPWGWLTCEETLTNGHGYVFLCDPEADEAQEPVRIPGYGRFNHEAAAIEPGTHLAFLTEDRDDGAFYRFVPDDPEEPFEGRLQAMRVEGRANFDTALSMEIGDVLPAEWVDISEPDPDDDSVRYEAWQRGAARVKRGEGIWYHDGAVYVCATSGGPVGGGQIFRYWPEDDALELVVQVTDTEILFMPDNITVSPWGQLFMVEDGGGSNYIRALQQGGAVVDFARNRLSSSELSGVCFSPDGSLMFVNIQWSHITLAIRGPFPGRSRVTAAPLAAAPLRAAPVTAPVGAACSSRSGPASWGMGAVGLGFLAMLTRQRRG